MSRLRPVAALIAVVLIAATAFEPFYLRIFTVDRRQLAGVLTELPYRKLPGLRLFLDEIRSQTQRDDTVAIYSTLLRSPTSEGGYDYIYERALYRLAGRNVVPLIDAKNDPQPENLRESSCIASYRAFPSFPGFVIVWSGRDGVLLRRQR
jgi:hypothetical protein